MKLKYKFFIFMVGLPSIALAIFLMFALRIFVQDKSVYILESNMNLANSIANQIENLGLEQSSALFDQIGLVIGTIIDRENRVLLSSLKERHGKLLPEIMPQSALDKLADATVQEGSFEDRSLHGETEIYNFIKLPKSQLLLLLSTPKESAVRASLLFLTKAIIIFVLLIIIAIWISWLLSKSMTGPLEILQSCMRDFSRGNFKVSAPFLGRDEIGDLSGYFNKMVGQIQDLIVVREEKLKVDVEMNLASDIQKKLFPPEVFSDRSVEFSGFYEPASNCGGDWWFYFKFKNHFVVCIGDVTGHGVHSALLTSACRATFSIISKNFESTSHTMAILNQSVFETVQGSINMTCFIAALNTETGELTYTNASHEAPIVMPDRNGPLKKSDFVVLADVHGPRLGERFDVTYSESKFQLATTQHILFYSDGLVDLSDKYGEKLGERRFLKFLGEKYSCQITADEKKHELINKLENYRGGHGLIDDLSFFFMKWNNNAA
jgi:sigma-B regulation protein RsbU (phosphoserine phosphatase)